MLKLNLREDTNGGVFSGTRPNYEKDRDEDNAQSGQKPATDFDFLNFDRASDSDDIYPNQFREVAA
jgi:hypothetical protein